MTIANIEQSSVADFATADEDPPVSNTGGNPLPPPALSGFPIEPDQKTKIDYLSITSLCSVQQMVDQFNYISPGGSLTMRVQARGWCGYPQSGLLFWGEEQVGLVAWGAADHDRNFFSLSGAACKYWNNWACYLLREILLNLKARISRIDLALDFFKGEISYNDCEQALQDGEFSLKQGGRKPSVMRHSSEAGWGNAGRTLEIGGKKTSKRIVCYEKGLEQFGKLAQKWDDEPSSVILDQFRFGVEDYAMADTKVLDWLRCEVRYSNDDRDLDVEDFEIVVKRDRYFAGAYPFCARVIERADGIRLPLIVSEKQAAVEKMKQAAKDSYGGLIRALREIGYSDNDIVSDLIGFKVSRRLEKAGLLNHIQEMKQKAGFSE